MNKKMANIDIDPIEEHNKTEEPTDENISLDPVTPARGGVQTWEPEHEQETSFGGRSHTSVLHKEYLVGKVYKLKGNKTNQRLEPSSSLFILGEDGRLYYKGKPLMNRNGELKMIGVIVDTLGKGGLREMGYNITKTNLKPRFVLDLMEKQAELPSPSGLAGRDEMELEEIAKSTEDLIFQINNQSQTDELFEHPLHDLLGLDKQLKSIRGSLKVEVAKKVQLEECIAKEC